MGWSCNASAGFVLDAFGAACVESTGSSNTYETKGKRYFFEVSSTEHDDGAITGSIFKFIGSGGFCVKSGSFRIEGDGTVTRAPAFLKKAAKTHAGSNPFRAHVGAGVGSGGPL